MTAAVLAGCTSPLASAPPSPLPSPTPHAPVASTLLQAADVPAGLQPCADSGSIESYITALRSSNAELANRLDNEWRDLQRTGATEAAISLFAADPASCAAELGAAANVKSAASLVIAFGDGGQADRTWQAGILGFSAPASGQQAPGITRGVSTGLGDSSWIYVQAPVQMAVWRRNVFVAVVVFTDLDAASFKAGAAAVNARLN